MATYNDNRSPNSDGGNMGLLLVLVLLVVLVIWAVMYFMGPAQPTQTTILNVNAPAVTGSSGSGVLVP